MCVLKCDSFLDFYSATLSYNQNRQTEPWNIQILLQSVRRDSLSRPLLSALLIRGRQGPDLKTPKAILEGFGSWVSGWSSQINQYFVVIIGLF